MKCLLCKQGETDSGHVTVVLQRGETVVIFKEVPAVVCENCGEHYLSESVTGRREPGQTSENPYPLRGLPIRYQDPTEPVAESDWEVLQ